MEDTELAKRVAEEIYKRNEFFFRGLKKGRGEYEDKIKAMIEERKSMIEEKQYYNWAEREKLEKEIDLLEEILEG